MSVPEAAGAPSEGFLGRTAFGDCERDHLRMADEFLPGGGLGGYAFGNAVRFVAVEGDGPRLRDESGNWYIDYVMGAGAMILGHKSPPVTQALHAQVDRGTHFFSVLNDVVLDLAREMKQAIPCAEAVTFSSTGSEATAYALRIARAFKKRDKILKFEGAYHGNHDYSLISTASQALANYPFGHTDTGGIPKAVAEQVLIAPYNDLDAVRSIVEAHADELAAIIVEPIQRIISPEPGFLEGLRRIADENDLLLIFDEVVTGFRLAYGGAQEYFGVKPDIAAYGKILGGGLALSGVAGRKDIIDLSSPARKGQQDSAYVNGTLHGNPLASAAGLATLRELKATEPYHALNARTAALRKELSQRVRKHGIPAVVVGEGSLWHVMFADRAPRNYADMLKADSRKGRLFDEQLIKHGIFVLPGVRRLMSVVHGDAEFDATVDAFDKVCRIWR